MLKILLALSLLSVSAMADLTALAPAPSESGLDSGLIRKYYLEGDFERAIPILENLLGSEPSINHADSVFVFKHLGVMCAAGGKTRARGKYYRAGDPASPEGEDPSTAPTKKEPAMAGSSMKTYYWIGAIAALAGVGVATYVLTQDQPVPAVKSHSLD